MDQALQVMIQKLLLGFQLDIYEEAPFCTKRKEIGVCVWFGWVDRGPDFPKLLMGVMKDDERIMYTKKHALNGRGSG